MKPLEVFTFPKNKCTNFILFLLISSALVSIFITQYYQVDQVTKEIFPCETYKPLNSPSQSFSEQMQSFPWQQYRNAVNKTDIPAVQHYSELLITNILIPFTIKEPQVPVNSSCQAPMLLEPERIQPCVRLQLPRKVGVLLNFGFDVEALELHLHELDAVVDKFFLMEGTKIHSRYLDTKPSIWDMVKYTTRFSKFHHKIVHFIVDDSDYAETEITVTTELHKFDRESLQKRVRLQKFLKWNTISGYFGPQDIIGVGDTDEIPSRNVVNFLKSCELEHENIQIGIWFPFPYIDTMFASDFPIAGHPFTFNRPVYSTVNALTSYFTNMTKGANNQEYGSILGGLHFSKYPYLPFQYVKLLTISESKFKDFNYIIDIGFKYKSYNYSNNESEENLFFNVGQDMWKKFAHRIKSVDWFRSIYGDDEADATIKFPWFYQCNPERFSSFHRKRDLRLV